MITITQLNEFEKQYNFQYPQLYKQLAENNMLNWGAISPDWSGTVYPTLLEKPPLLLHGDDFEIFDFERIGEEMEAFCDPNDYRQPNPAFTFIPFAQTGGGDLYCFQLDRVVDGDVPIVLVWHDMNEANVLAKNLQDFIFRSMVETLTEFDKRYSLLASDDLYRNLASYKQSHLAYLTDNQQQVIKQYYQLIIDEERPLEELLTDDERKTLLTKMNDLINFADLNIEFKYQLN